MPRGGDVELTRTFGGLPWSKSRCQQAFAIAYPKSIRLYPTLYAKDIDSHVLYEVIAHGAAGDC